MELAGVHRVYFIGIGGIGMSALARYFVRSGKEVAGYDKVPTPLTRALESEGAYVHYADSVAEVPGAFKEAAGTLVVYTPAVPASHAELAFFRQEGFQVVKRSQLLGMISRETRCLAVAGTHGKTTTSCILAHLLKEAGLEVMAFLGGVSEDFGSNFLMEGTEFSVVEADEYDRSFLWLEPEVACVTSMDADHLDIYGDDATLKATFAEFARKVRPGGTLVVRNGLPLQGLTYGIDDDAQYTIRNLRTEEGAYRFDIHTPEHTYRSVRFAKPGRHNLLNGLAAFTMAVQVAPQPDRLVKALATFKGVERRFSYKLNTEQLIFIDDYAHHPTEIDAVCDAIREMHPGREILAVFQPHLFSRTRDFGAEFARSLSRFDAIWLLDIYPAREEPIEGIDSAWLLGQIRNPRKRLIEKSRLIPEITRENPQILLTIGAGDIGLEVNPIKDALSHAS
ncbi:UDP-N-acetylmuramate--L-alanine ligase [Robiginitalea sp. SC105]|uniref:UDP-N-acetylmuramate--L-alanine ligase n=1 Tax=Robiginitalea sp. SC105 TaxID=2762332 RepID=UPI00163A7DAC|nr:UDP-N-acetylmuramate--L-alanine ligase [Robiginitalea sp. SC105]MBC2838986.1 UDP-N-acetylmuramate--L-alanine ligase [Robiginitalea sp. SC105]